MTAHEASESQAPPGAPAGSFQEPRHVDHVVVDGLAAQIGRDFRLVFILGGSCCDVFELSEHFHNLSGTSIDEHSGMALSSFPSQRLGTCTGMANARWQAPGISKGREMSRNVSVVGSHSQLPFLEAEV